MFHKNTYVFLLSYLAISHSLRNEYEPMCSKFHYEEQLLEKMIRLEIKFETLLDNVEKLETSIKEERRIMNEERADGKQQMETWMEDKENVIESRTKDIKTTFEDTEMKLARLSADFTELQNKTIHKVNDIASKVSSTKSRNVAFEAHVVPKGNPATGEKIVFTDTKLNEGDGYDNTTGVFTVPEDGIYLLMVQFCLQNERYLHFDFILQGNIMMSSKFYRGTVAQYACYSTQTTVKAEIDDKIWIQSNRNQDTYTIFNSRYFVNSFTGILIS